MNLRAESARAVTACEREGLFRPLARTRLPATDNGEAVMNRASTFGRLYNSFSVLAPRRRRMRRALLLAMLLASIGLPTVALRAVSALASAAPPSQGQIGDYAGDYAAGHGGDAGSAT